MSLEAAYTLTQLDDETLDEVIAQGKEGMREKTRALKGLVKESQDKERRDALLGDLEIEALQLSWVERREGVDRPMRLKVTDPDQLYKLLSTLKRIGLIELEG